jgi:hypothetical protein
MNRAAWSDIATAPDDGTPVLISRLTTAGRETLIAYFTDHWADYFSGEQIDSAPTHWMALPADPDDARAAFAALRTAPSPETETAKEALRPFAMATADLDTYSGWSDDTAVTSSRIIDGGDPVEIAFVTMGDFRRAAEAYCVLAAPNIATVGPPVTTASVIKSTGISELEPDER